MTIDDKRFGRMWSRSGIKRGYGLHHPPLLVRAEFREDRQRQYFAASAFGFRHRAGCIPQIGKGLLQVQRNRIVDFALDAAGS